MPVPINYRSAGNINASYDWIDLVSGIGYRRYYACQGMVAAGATGRVLTTQQVAGKPYKVSSAPAGSGTLWDYDFDITFKSPAIISGTAVVNVPHQIANANPTYGRVTANIYHVTAAGAETLLGSTFSPDRSTQKYFMECLFVALTEKKFAIGEKLRLNIVYDYNVGGVAPTYILYFDPATRVTYVEDEGGTTNSNITADVPFKIDI